MTKSQLQTQIDSLTIRLENQTTRANNLNAKLNAIAHIINHGPIKEPKR